MSRLIDSIRWGLLTLPVFAIAAPSELDSEIDPDPALESAEVLDAPGGASSDDVTRSANLTFAELGQALGVTLDENGRCRYSRGRLTGLERAIVPDATGVAPNDLVGDWNCHMLKQQISNDGVRRCTPDPTDVFSFRPSEPTIISGKTRYYMGLIRKRYRYELVPLENGGTLVRVKIHFRGEPTNDATVMTALRAKLERASALWTEQSPVEGLSFSFEEVANREDSFFSVELKRKIGAITYDKAWGVDEPASIIAHEVSHMLGLVDEYRIIRSVLWQVHDETDSRQCNLRDLMCDPYASRGRQDIAPYLYYTILRRPVCKQRS